MTLSVLANIDVDDLRRAADFYCSALDLTIGRRFGDTAVELVGASCAIYLLKQVGHGFCLIEFLGRGYDEIATST